MSASRLAYRVPGDFSWPGILDRAGATAGAREFPNAFETRAGLGSVGREAMDTNVHSAGHL